MHVGTISFCDRIGYNIKCDLAKKDVLTDIEKFGVKIIQKHYEKLTSASLPILNNNPHLICTKTNGNPYLLYLTKKNDVNQCIFIDKKVQQGYFYPRMVMIKAWFDDELFTGTLIDGEMVKDNTNKWIFISNDLIVGNNVLMTNVNLLKRIQMLIDIFENKYIHDPWVAYCRFEVKKYFNYDELDNVLNSFIPSIPYSTRGLIFKSLHLKFKDFLVNFDDKLIKNVKRESYKRVSDFLTKTDQILEKKEEPTKIVHNKLSSYTCNNLEEVMFYCKKTNTPDVYELTNNSNETFIACVPTMKISQFLRNAMVDCNVIDKIVVCCTWNTKFNKWMPHRIVS